MARKRRYLDETEVSKEANQVIKDKFTVNGVTYGTIPSHYTKGKIANSKTKDDITSDRVYVRQGDDGKWYQTRMDKDANNINYYLDNKALIDRSNEIIESQSKQGIGHKIEVDKADARARQQWFSNEDATKFLLTTAGLGALGGGLISAPLATTLGLAGGYGGGKLVDKGMQLGTGKTWGQWASDKTGLPEWLADFTNPGMLAGGFGAGDIATNYLNPRSLLNQNIRTAIFNRKTPLGYDLRDPNNLIPFIEGIGNSMIGRNIPQNSQALSTYNNILRIAKMTNLGKTWSKTNIPKPKTGQSALDYVSSLPQDLREAGMFGSNRAIGFDKYLGLNNYDNMPLMYSKNGNQIRLTKYIRNKDGSYNVKFDKDVAYKYLRDGRINPNINKFIDKNSDNFIGYDYLINNHGGMNGKLSLGNTPRTYNLTATDIFDLMPFQKFNSWKYYNKIPKSIRDFEVSKIIPGAKPYEVKFDFGKELEYPFFMDYYNGSKEDNFMIFKDWLNGIVDNNGNKYGGHM